MSTPIGAKRTEPRKPLRRVAIKKTPTKRARAEMKAWRAVKEERLQKMVDKFGYPKCEYCLKPIIMASIEGHHNNHDRRENTLTNCRIVHSWCNVAIEDHNVRDVPSLL
jgi:hypothetical protein